MTIVALGPREIQVNKNNNIPDEMIQAANELLAENLDVHSDATFTSKALTRRYRELVAGSEATEEMIAGIKIEMRWLDIEDRYRRKGWDVEYDKPAYNETYDGYYEFSAKK